MWRSLRHTFVLPFLGIYRNESMEQIFLVSPYMMNGTLARWRKKANPSNAEVEERVWFFYPSAVCGSSPSRKMLEVAKGIEYIHLEGVVHGDLRGVFDLKHKMLRC
jgi:serine/threonine protein kinase